MNTVIETLDKANCVLDILLDDYSIFDAQNPTTDDKLKYSSYCGTIHSLISLASDCVAAANKELRKKNA